MKKSYLYVEMFYWLIKSLKLNSKLRISKTNPFSSQNQDERESVANSGALL